MPQSPPQLFPSLLIAVILGATCTTNTAGGPGNSTDNSRETSDADTTEPPPGGSDGEKEQTPSAQRPRFEWLRPQGDSEVTNPVEFQWRTPAALRRLRVLNTELGTVWSREFPAKMGRIQHDFGPAGFEGALQLRALYEDDRRVRIPRRIRVQSRKQLQPGNNRGSFEVSYYHVAVESSSDSEDDVTLYDSNCQRLDTVSESYAERLCIEGTGRLEDDRILNYAEICDCGPQCPSGTIVCYKRLDPERFPWGQGSRGNPLEPFRSVATDPDSIETGQWVYIPELDGLRIESRIDDFTHDGCLRADDVGSAIQDRRIDVFTGTKPARASLSEQFPTGDELQVYTDSPKCWRYERDRSE